MEGRSSIVKSVAKSLVWGMFAVAMKLNVELSSPVRRVERNFEQRMHTTSMLLGRSMLFQLALSPKITLVLLHVLITRLPLSSNLQPSSWRMSYSCQNWFQKRLKQAWQVCPSTFHKLVVQQSRLTCCSLYLVIWLNHALVHLRQMSPTCPFNVPATTVIIQLHHLEEPVHL